MGIVLTVNKSGKTIKLRQGQTVFRNVVLEVIAIGETTQRNKKTGKPYLTINIKTEKQLARFLYDRYGAGRYILKATIKKHKFFSFFKGEVNEEGWVFETEDYIKGKTQWLQKEIDNAEDEEDADFWEREMSINKSELKKEQKTKKYGFAGYLESFGRRGVFHRWDDMSDDRLKSQNIISNTKIKKKMEDMSIEELNNF